MKRQTRLRHSFFEFARRCRRGSRPLAVAAAAATLGAGATPHPEEDPVHTLKVAAVFNDTDIQLRLVYPTDSPSWYHQYWVYKGGEWARRGGAEEGPDPCGLYEDRISVMIDDGSVERFGVEGGYVTVHPGMRATATAADPGEVEEHPHLGGRLGRSDVRKFIPESRTGPSGPDSWRNVRPPGELERLRDEGVFLDLWQWRSHRSNPIGYADNGYVLDYRHGAEGRSMYTTNQDADSGLPLKMYDPQRTGRAALRIEKLRRGEYGQDDPYFLREDDAIPFDPDGDWEEGDALPHRLLREPSGSRGAIRADGEYRDGAWRVRLTRSLEAPDPRDSKSFVPGETRQVAFAVHAASGTRFHRVSNPLTLGLGVEADLVAQKVEGDLDAAETEWTEIPVFYPGDPTAP